MLNDLISFDRAFLRLINRSLLFLSLFFIIQFNLTRAVDDSILKDNESCFYYSSKNQSIVEQTTCQFKCCSKEIAKDLESTCCNDGSKWWISLIVIFSILFICAVVITYGFVHFWIAKCCKKRRNAAAEKNYAASVDPTSQQEDDGQRSVVDFRPSSFGNAAHTESSLSHYSIGSFSKVAEPNDVSSRNNSIRLNRSSLNNDTLPNYDDLDKNESFFVESVLNETTTAQQEAKINKPLTNQQQQQDSNQLSNENNNKKTKNNTDNTNETSTTTNNNNDKSKNQRSNSSIVLDPVNLKKS